MTDSKYWEKYYKHHLALGDPSLFAKYVQDEFNPQGKMIELGCGTGRDTVYFASNGIMHITGIDQCPNVVTRLSGLNLPNAAFIQNDFTNLPYHSKYNHIYSRFTLHSVSRNETSRTLKWAYASLEPNGQLYIEVRSINDELYGIGEDLGDDAWFTDHYRRFIRMEELCDELDLLGFNLLLKKESRGFAPYKNENPSVIRIVAGKSES